METAQSKLKLRIVVIATIAIAVMVIIGGAVYALMQVGSDDTKTADTSQTTQKTDKKAVSQEQLDHGMTEVNSAVTRSKQAHSAAVNAANDAAKRVKVSQ